MTEQRFFFTARHQWQFLFRKCNWIDFTLINLEFENDKLFGNLEFGIWLFGLGAVLTYHYADTEYASKHKQEVEAALRMPEPSND